MPDSNQEKLVQLEEALDAAGSEVRAAEEARNTEVMEVRRKIEENHKPIIDAAKARQRAASRAIAEFRGQIASHPWEGKRVRRDEMKYGKRAGTIRGVVEIRRIGTIFAENVGFRPSYGVAFVRLIKADGKVGIRIDSVQGEAIERRFELEAGQ